MSNKKKLKRVLLKYKHYGYPFTLQLGTVVETYRNHLNIEWNFPDDRGNDKSSESYEKVIFIPEWMYWGLFWL